MKLSVKNEILMRTVESCPQARGARPCTKATEAEARTKVIFEVNRPPL